LKSIAMMRTRTITNLFFATSSRTIRNEGRRALSSASEDPGQFVSGITKQDLEDPATLAFFNANFPNRDEENAPLAAAEKKKLVSTDESPMNIRKLSCWKRDSSREEGTRACNKLRDQLWIPGLVYGSDPTKGIFPHVRAPDSRIFVKTPWKVLHRELDRYGMHFESRVYDLTVYEDETDEEGSTMQVLARDVQRHPVKNQVFCVNYLRYFPGKKIKIPVHYINEEESTVLKRGGFVVPINKFVECVIDEGVQIPERLDVECSGLLKEVVRFNRIMFPEGVHPSPNINPKTFNVGTVFGRNLKAAGGSQEDE